MCLPLKSWVFTFNSKDPAAKEWQLLCGPELPYLVWTYVLRLIFNLHDPRGVLMNMVCKGSTSCC